MGSTDSPNSWAPYYAYRDCSQGICSFYCPQWCDLVYPPPYDGDDDPPFNFSPLIIAVIGVLSSAILLIVYYLIITRYCRRRRSEQSQVFDFETNQNINHDHFQANSVGLDEPTIKSIAVFKYKKGDGLVEGTECSVCLSEFQENEDLRLLPKCSHSFHILCIDTWLKSHSSCPLCRANVVSNNPVTSTRDLSSVNVLSLQVSREDDASFVAENGVERVNVIVSIESQQERSSSLSVADILRIRDDYEDIELGIGRFCSGVGSSRGDGGENLMKHDEMKRSNFSR